ncbi:MAG: hypothetical protein HAW58_04120 [Candidatus Thioglobus sp.]|nr:hypothetical protein [Candidatus Thioglobus sp.]
MSPNDATDPDLTWAITNAGSTGATLSNGNVLSTTAAGEVIVTATADGQTDQQTITITAPAPTNVPVASITIT